MTRNQLWQKKLLNELPDRRVKTFGVDADEIARLAGEPGVYAAETEGGVVIGQAIGDRLVIHYAYDSTDSMREEFRPAFDDIEEQAMADPDVLDVELQLSDMTSRPPIEILLKASMFKIAEEWLLMGRRLPVEPADDEPSADVGDGARFRPATPDDGAVIAAIDDAAYGELAVREPIIRSWMGRGLDFGLLERDGAPVAYAAWRSQGPRGIVERLGVLPDERRKGYGRALLERTADRLTRLGARRLELLVTPSPITIGFARALHLAQQSAGIAYRKKIGEKPEVTGAIIRGFGWSDMRRRR